MRKSIPNKFILNTICKKVSEPAIEIHHKFFLS